MNQTAPRYLLFTQASDHLTPEHHGGRWRFVLEEIGSDFRIDESDEEPNMRGERLQLLAVVRGLEALEQPSLITLITPSRYVGRGIRSGLRQWKSHDWTWEQFGQVRPIRNRKLWKRIDAAISIHQVSCRVWQFDPPHRKPASSSAADGTSNGRRALAPVFSGPNTGSTPELSRATNRIRLDDSLRSRCIQAGRQAADQVTSFLQDRVKPIGEGRAYGYAVN